MKLKKEKKCSNRVPIKQSVRKAKVHMGAKLLDLLFKNIREIKLL